MRSTFSPAGQKAGVCTRRTQRGISQINAVQVTDKITLKAADNQKPVAFSPIINVSFGGPPSTEVMCRCHAPCLRSRSKPYPDQHFSTIVSNGWVKSSSIREVIQSRMRGALMFDLVIMFCCCDCLLTLARTSQTQSMHCNHVFGRSTTTHSKQFCIAAEQPSSKFAT